MRQAGAGAVVVLLAVSCGSAQTDAPAPAPASDPRLAEMQKSMTELLERIDVLSDRMARLEESSARPAGPAPAAVVPAPQTQRAVAGAQLAETYRSAIVLHGKQRIGEARAAFQKVFDADPSGDLADNALFWIGETYFAAGDYGNAMSFYRRVAEDYSEQNKAPDALLKLALAQEKTGDLALARKTLQDVIRRYPYSTPASSAKAELQRIKY